jgi:hypothetical protein
MTMTETDPIMLECFLTWTELLEKKNRDRSSDVGT